MIRTIVAPVLRPLGALGGAPAAGLLLVAMFAVYVLHEPSALSQVGIGNLLNNAIVLAIAAAGLTLVVLCGELDLSGPAVLAIANVMVATLSTGPLGPFGTLLAVAAAGGLIGTLNGVLVAYLGQQSVAATLGTLIVCQGIALLILPAPGGEVAAGIVDGISGDYGPVPGPALILAAMVVAWLLLRRAPLGIALYAVGADRAASRLSGLKVERVRLFAFAAAGLCYALAGYVHGAEIGSGDPRISDSFLLFLFASVAIGGTALTGGRGGLIGTLAGAGILTVLQKMLFALGVADFYTNVCNGIILVIAILFGRISRLAAHLRHQGRSA